MLAANGLVLSANDNKDDWNDLDLRPFRKTAERRDVGIIETQRHAALKCHLLNGTRISQEIVYSATGKRGIHDERTYGGRRKDRNRITVVKVTIYS